jgi:hypothetical protein
MIDSNNWLQNVSQKLAANGYSPLNAQAYQPQGFKYSAGRSRFELSKFGMAESFFTFAEIPNLTKEILMHYSTTAFKFVNTQKKVGLPNGLFVATFSYAVVITANLDSQLAQYVKAADLIKHWSAFEMPIVFDLSDGSLNYFEKTPLWGAAYYSGFRKEIQKNLS